MNISEFLKQHTKRALKSLEDLTSSPSFKALPKSDKTYTWKIQKFSPAFTVIKFIDTHNGHMRTEHKVVVYGHVTMGMLVEQENLQMGKLRQGGDWVRMLDGLGLEWKRLDGRSVKIDFEYTVCEGNY